MVEESVVDATSPIANLPFDLSVEDIKRDFWICCISREASLLARREVLTGKAKFGITGDGKEVPQVAMARAFRRGDFRSGYYRDQTLLLALELITVEDYFAQLYADSHHDKLSGGRQMNSHFATPLIDRNGQWLPQRDSYNISADISSTGGQMARGLGLALASKQYRENPTLQDTPFSDRGNEVCFCTIGDASTSEGVFWESVNAAAVMQVPLAVFVWDDGYGISVPIRYQTAKASISQALSGMEGEPGQSSIALHRSAGWDYPTLLKVIAEGIERVRNTHQPGLFHINELTQPQGHSTSGSHERYKDEARLQWEREYDCIRKMAQWMMDSGLASEEEINKTYKAAKTHVRAARDRAWRNSTAYAHQRLSELEAFYAQLPTQDKPFAELNRSIHQHTHPLLSEVMENGRRLYFELRSLSHPLGDAVGEWLEAIRTRGQEDYHTHLYSSSDHAALKVKAVPAVYSDQSPLLNGYEIINRFFKVMFSRYDNLYAFGEDLGKIGGVNQGFAGLQEQYGESRIFDTGIREWTIMGQAIGMAMRGLRPIGEIQYLDYLIYGLEPLMDDLATLRWRSDNLQQAPAIIRTRGHRLEGIWHSGSPMGMIVNSLRGIYVCVPRNMVQAIGMYNTLLQSDDPGLVIECLNGYRLKERLPDNFADYTVALGQPETLRQGDDITIVTYGSCVRIAAEACDRLSRFGIAAELIDVQTLLPFDIDHQILDSLQQTGRILFLDEDVPGGATAYMMQQVLEVQGGYQYLDSAPATLTAAAHRPPYGSDGDYFSKPSAEDVFECAYRIIYEAEPGRLAPL